MRKGIIVFMTLTILLIGTRNLYAYRYMFSNSTRYFIKVTAKIYNGEDRNNQIEPNRSYTFSTDQLLKSWKAEAFLGNQWKQVLHLTCDFLPGNHSFSIHVDETTDPHGTLARDWYSTGH
jgi:hypothetical protein